jgi:class 3 adenylate cyclase
MMNAGKGQNKKANGASPDLPALPPNPSASSTGNHGLLQRFMKAISPKLALGLFFVSALMVLFISVVVNIHMNRHVRIITEATQKHLMSAAQALAQLISAEELDRYHTEEDTKTPEYRELKLRLSKFAEEYNVKYAYYFRRYDASRLQYIVDNDFDPETVVGPGVLFEAAERVIIGALGGNIGATDLGSYSPGWDDLITGYAPVYDSEGNFYCGAGVDIGDDFIVFQRRDSRNMTILQIFAIFISVLFGALSMRLYRRKARQIEVAHIKLEDAHTKLQYFNNNLRRAFSTYLSEDVVEEIVADPSRLQLGGIERHMTAMFTDVKGFTGIAEKLSPEHLVDLLNCYLSSMSDIILEQKGTIDKYEGDAIVSFFGAPLDLPDHALRACTAAIIMKRLEGEVNAHIMKNGISPTPMLTRIGINSGNMVVGNMGTMKKMNYTIISNAVNLASRLEGVNKQYGTWILAAEATIQETGDIFLTRRLDQIRVVGMHEPVRVYEILETKADAPDALHKLANLFQSAQELFEARDWKKAEEKFNRILKMTPHDGPSLFYRKRCRQYQKHPPKSNWDGILNITEK